MDKHMNPTENTPQTVDERNAEYLRKIDQGLADAKAGRVVTKTMEELENMARETSAADERKLAESKLMSELDKGRRSGEEEGWLTADEVDEHFRTRSLEKNDRAPSAEDYLLKDLESDQYYAIFFYLCRKFNVSWTQASERDREYIAEMTRVTYEAEKARREGRPVSDVTPSFSDPDLAHAHMEALDRASRSPGFAELGEAFRIRKEAQRRAWGFGVGLNMPIDWEPEPELLQVIEQNIRGKISDSEMLDKIKEMYAADKDEAPTLQLSPSLSMEEIEANFAGMDFFELLSASLEEALAHSKGDPTPGTVEHKYILPDEGLKMAERHRLGEISDSELAVWCIDWCADVALAEKVLQEYRKDPASFSVDKIIEALGLTDEKEDGSNE